MYSNYSIDRKQNNLIMPVFPEVHLTPDSWINHRENSHKAYSLMEQDMPRFSLKGTKTVQGRISKIYEVLDWLDVENCSRYTPCADSAKTFCNIYAYDVAYLLKIFIPRVWWTSDALLQIRKGLPIKPIYGVSVREMNCNSVFYWLEDFGSSFGWKKIEKESILRDIVMEGTIGVIIARGSCESHGHISLVIPEKETFKFSYTEQPSQRIQLLQTQAGRVNKKFHRDIWWRERVFEKMAFWIYGLV